MGYRAAIIQLRSTAQPEHSLSAAEAAIREAAAGGARLVGLPEGVGFIGPEEDKHRHAEPLDGPSFGRLGRIARELGIYLMAGSLLERSEDPRRPYNTAVLFDPRGELLAVYRKLHLFDVDLSPEGPRIAESDTITPGSRAVVVATELGCLGFSICYDVRFPELYRALRAAGAEVLFVPSAFTVPTGADHWEVLLRARAIENQCYVVAPAQVGRHYASRRSYGRSMLVDPWGLVLATCPDRPSVAFAEIDLEQLRDVRRRMPCESHRKSNLEGAVERRG